MNQANQKRTAFNPRALKPGAVVPGTKWSFVRKLGEGGMGVVIEVVKPPSIRGAMKVMVPEMAGRKDHVERFLHEVHVLTMLDHENVVRVFDCDTLDDGSPYLVMELLRGSTLRGTLRTLKQGMVAPVEVYDIARSVGAALECAHRAGIVHRDVKPDNVFLHESRPNTSRVVLLDFGVAALIEDARAVERSGTPMYMAPERYRGEPATPASDIYSFGLVIYEMLTGRVPWDVRGAPLRQTMLAHIHEPPSPPSRYAAWLPSSVEALILAALAKDPSRRPENANVLAQDLYELQWCGSSPKRIADFNTTSPSMSTMIERSRAASARESVDHRTDEGMLAPSQPSVSVGEHGLGSPERIAVDRQATTPALTPPPPVRRATDTDVLLSGFESTGEGEPAAPKPSEVSRREGRGLRSALFRWLPAIMFLGTIALGVVGLWLAGLVVPRRSGLGRPAVGVVGVPTANLRSSVATGTDTAAAPTVSGVGPVSESVHEAEASTVVVPRSVPSVVAPPQSSSPPAPRPPPAAPVRRAVAPAASGTEDASWPLKGPIANGGAIAVRKGSAPKASASAPGPPKTPATPPDDGRELFEPVP